MGRVLASKLSPRRIRGNVVTPGAPRTPIWFSVASSPEAVIEMEKRIARAIPLGRFAEVDEVAKTVLCLASEDATHIQAAEIVGDGGTTGAPFGAPIYQREGIRRRSRAAAAQRRTGCR
jgi:NAD(P)-dependent dehydrogenase (short-subunit alcohol dehydrogenase family)